MTDLCAGPVGRPSTHPGAGPGPGPLIYHETVTYRHRSTPRDHSHRPLRHLPHRQRSTRGIAAIASSHVRRKNHDYGIEQKNPLVGLIPSIAAIIAGVLLYRLI